MIHGVDNGKKSERWGCLSLSPAAVVGGLGTHDTSASLICHTLESVSEVALKRNSII